MFEDTDLYLLKTLSKTQVIFLLRSPPIELQDYFQRYRLLETWCFHWLK